ncbi:hypothetical protein ACWEQP_09215 [Streptomyces sp. NPDC004044]
MPNRTPLQQAKSEALAAGREALAASSEAQPLPVPDGYYSRPEVPASEVTEALAHYGIHNHRRNG